MSILLDALKKSETQRQLGKTPTIHTVVKAPHGEKVTEPQWISLSMLALSALAIAWFGWQQFREPTDRIAATGVDVVATPQLEEVPAQGTRAPATETEPENLNRPAVASLWNTKKDLTGLTVLPARTPEETQQHKEKLKQSFNSYEAPPHSAAVADARLPPASTAKSSSAPVTAQATADRPVPAQEAPVSTPSRRSSRLQPHESEPISFWQIPQALRDGLPEFRINVLVYAEKPEDRFLLINGLRLVEKQELLEGVVLDEIRRDGAVFRFRNYRFLVKG